MIRLVLVFAFLLLPLDSGWGARKEVTLPGKVYPLMPELTPLPSGDRGGDAALQGDPAREVEAVRAGLLGKAQQLLPGAASGRPVASCRMEASREVRVLLWIELFLFVLFMSGRWVFDSRVQPEYGLWRLRVVVDIVWLGMALVFLPVMYLGNSWWPMIGGFFQLLIR